VSPSTAGHGDTEDAQKSKGFLDPRSKTLLLLCVLVVTVARRNQRHTIGTHNGSERAAYHAGELRAEVWVLENFLPGR
jgi:hypothetical protein